MTNPRLAEALESTGAEGFILHAQEIALIRDLSQGTILQVDQPKPERLPRLAFVYETQGIGGYLKAPTDHLDATEDSGAENVQQQFFWAFACWRSLASLGSESSREANPSVSAHALDIVNKELPGEPLPPPLTLAFRLAISGLLADRDAEVRLELARFVLSVPNTGDWRERVTIRVFTAVVLLVRKGNGWSDIEAALALIAELRALQSEYEDTYLNRGKDLEERQREAIGLVGLYNLAQMVSIVGDYLSEGQGSITQINLRLDRHHDQSVDAFGIASQPFLTHLCDLLWVGLRELARNSIWTHLAGTGARLGEFARILTQKGRPNPVIELWPSQQGALRRRLLDTYPRAILVEMPTSAGKTLLAKFLIVQTKALNPSGTVAYVVPTRALVNQVTIDLREDFRQLVPPLSVEQAVPAVELDPAEARLLGQVPDVLVTTAEKLDLLIRRNHPSTQDLALIVADEAHNIRDGERGARLELLLGTMKRDRVGARFLVLSPFLPNDNELVSWLGEDRALPPISLNWKPSRKVVGAVRFKGSSKAQELVLDTLDAADNVDLGPNVEIPLGQAPNVPKQIYRLTKATVEAVRGRGSVLILCRGQSDAMKRTREIAQTSPSRASDPFVEAVCRYLSAEVGRESGLVEFIRKGVAYHHAGLSTEARWLVESLVRRRHVDVICGTTTLSQGVNFPIRTVIVETLRKGRQDSLTYEDFWNVAGRAGRALVDTVGLVAFPTATSVQRERYQDFLRGEAAEITSQLISVIQRADEIGDRFDIATLYKYPQLAPLLQFLAHALRVSMSGDVAEDIEDLLRASLAYHQAQKMGRETVRKLISLSRAYLDQVRGRPDVVALADRTGFATPSVLQLLRRKGDNPEFAAAENWQPDHLFGEDIAPLQRRIEAIADLPEMKLGQAHGGPFSAGKVAEILRGWVQGESLEALTEKHPIEEEDDPETRLSNFSRYLFGSLLGRASWGLGALEGVSLAGAKDSDWEDVGYVPSMVFFGVKQKEAVWLRMAGVPRVGADGLAEQWSSGVVGQPETYEAIRSWVANLSDAEWARALPAGGGLTAGDMRILWKEFTGYSAAPAR